MSAPVPSPPRAAPVDLAKHRRERRSTAGHHRRGEIWFVAADAGSDPVGSELWSDRPAVVVSNNTINSRGGFAQVVYLSTSARKRSGPTHVEVPGETGQAPRMALCEQVHTVDASRLLRRIGAIEEGTRHEIDAAIALSLSLGRNPDTYSLFRKWEEQVKVHGIDIAAEIRALSGRTSDQRVESLTRALEIVTIERDSYRNLYEAAQTRPAAMQGVVDALSLDDQDQPRAQKEHTA